MKDFLKVRIDEGGVEKPSQPLSKYATNLAAAFSRNCLALGNMGFCGIIGCVPEGEGDLQVTGSAVGEANTLLGMTAVYLTMVLEGVASTDRAAAMEARERIVKRLQDWQPGEGPEEEENDGGSPGTPDRSA